MRPNRMLLHKTTRRKTRKSICTAAHHPTAKYPIWRRGQLVRQITDRNVQERGRRGKVPSRHWANSAAAGAIDLFGFFCNPYCAVRGSTATSRCRRCPPAQKMTGVSGGFFRDFASRGAFRQHREFRRGVSGEGVAVKYTRIDEYRDQFAITQMRRLLAASRTGNCKWRERTPSARLKEADGRLRLSDSGAGRDRIKWLGVLDRR
jgi:hypothetical protein